MAVQFILSGGKKCPTDISKCISDRESKTQLSDYTEATNFDIFETETKKGIRNPSYCDRILYRFKQMNPEFTIEQTSYKSFTNETISKSDHDMVYATYQVKNKDDNKFLDILFITWNQANLDIKEDIVFKGFDDFNNYDVVIFSQQETQSTDILQLSLKNKYATTHTIFDSSVGAGMLEYVVGAFNVRITVMIKKLFEALLHTKEYLCFGYVCTKSIVGVGVAIKIDDNKEFSLNVFGCHMPINTSKDDLGYEERVTSYQNMETHMQTFSKLGIGKFIAELDIIGGDMNFRYNSGSMKGDQLIEGMKKGEIFSLFKEGEITFGPTCKMCVCDEPIKEVINDPR